MVHGCCSSPKPAPHGKTVNVHPVGRIGRYEGTAMFLGRREHTESSLQSAFIRRENLNTCVVPPRCRRTSIRKPRQDTVPRADYAGNKKAEKKPKKPLSGEVSPLTTWGLIRVRPCQAQGTFAISRASTTPTLRGATCLLLPATEDRAAQDDGQ